MEEILAILMHPTARLVSAYFGAAFWAFMYFRLRRKVRLNEMHKGDVLDEAAEVVNNKKSSKTQKSYALGVMFGVGQIKNLVIKEQGDGRTSG